MEAQPTLFATSPRRGGQAFNAGWIITAPWAHPFWGQYLVALLDLTTPMFLQGEPILHLPGATHEVQVWALNPDHPVTEFKIEPPTKVHRLTPMNMGYQFIARDDAEALDRIQKLVNLIDRRELSPDTDFRRVWDGIFADGATLALSDMPGWYDKRH